MANKNDNNIQFCNEPPALSEFIDIDDQHKWFGKIIPKQNPNNPQKPKELICYYWFKASLDCKRIFQQQTNNQYMYESGEGWYTGHPFSWPLAKGLMNDTALIQSIENNNAWDKWILCKNCSPFFHYTTMIYYKKVTTVVQENVGDPYGIVSCPSSCALPDSPTYNDFLNSGAIAKCPNYYKVNGCRDCASYFSGHINPNISYWISLPWNQKLHPAFPILRMPNYSDMYKWGWDSKRLSYECYKWEKSPHQIQGKGYVPLGSDGKTSWVEDKSFNEPGGVIRSGFKGSLYALRTCEDCLHELIVAIEFCGEGCNSDDLINSYTGNILVDNAAAVRASNCIKSGKIRLFRVNPYDVAKNFFKRNDGKVYRRASDNKCVKLRYITCPNKIILYWANFFYNINTKQMVFVGPANRFLSGGIYQRNLTPLFNSIFYNTCCDCKAVGGTVGPQAGCGNPGPRNPPPLPVKPPVRGGGVKNPGLPPGTKWDDGPIYFINMVTPDGIPFQIWTLQLPSKNDYRTRKNAGWGKDYIGSYACVEKATRKKANGQWAFEYRCARFQLDDNYELINTKAQKVSSIGTTPSKAFWDAAANAGGVGTYDTCGQCSLGSIGTCQDTC